MKRVLALALALVLSLSVGVLAFASEEQSGLDLGTGLKGDPQQTYYAPGHTYKIPIKIIDENGALILDPVTAGYAYDDGYLKLTFRMTAGADYLNTYEFKKNASKELYVEIKTKTMYLGKVQDFKFEIKVIFAKPAKIGEKIALNAAKYENNGYTATPNALFGAYKPAATGKKVVVDVAAANKGVPTLSNNDYLLEKREYKYGWSKEYEIGAEDFGSWKFGADGKAIKVDVPTDFEFYSDPGFDSVTDGNDAKVEYLHLKKGTGDVSCMNFGDNAYVEVKFADQTAINMFYSEGANKVITAKYPDVDFQFWDWRGNPTFDFTANVELTVDEDEVGEEPVLYFFDGTNLTKVNADLDDGQFLFRTRSLGCYVAASKALNITAPIETAAPGAETTAAAAGTGNPHTGVSDFVGVAVALAVVSMAAAGAVALKK